jgi:hypothetical protein
MSKLNSKTLMIAAALLIVLALLVLATPLLRPASGFSNRSGSARQFTSPGNNGQANPGQVFPGGQNGQAQSTPGFNTRQFPGRRSSILRLGFLSGITGTIVYAILLLVALIAAVGMFITKRWGQILGIIMAIVYLLLALVSLLPMILLGFARALNDLTLGLDILRLLLALAVIVLALIPAKKVMTPSIPAIPATPPAASA